MIINFNSIEIEVDDSMSLTTFDDQINAEFTVLIVGIDY